LPPPSRVYYNIYQYINLNARPADVFVHVASPQPVDRSSPLPLFYQVAEDLRRRLSDGKCKVGQRFRTVREVQQEYVVSFVTAQRALARLAHEGFVRGGRGRATVVARRAYPRRARSRRRAATRRVVALWPTSRSVSPSLQTHVASILEGLRLALPEHTVSLELASELLLEKQAQAYLDSLITTPENVAFCLVSAPAYVKRYFEAAGVPAVVAGNVEEGIDLPFVSSSEEQAHYDLTRHLVTRGHRRIIHVIGAPRVAGHEDRLRGFRRALVAAGIADEVELRRCEMCVPFDRSTALAQLRRVVEEGEGITAAVCTGPALASWMRAAGGPRMHVAYDVNSEPHDALPPGTTLLIWPGEEMGYTIGRLLRDQLEGSHVPGSQVFDYVRIQDYEAQEPHS